MRKKYFPLPYSSPLFLQSYRRKIKPSTDMQSNARFVYLFGRYMDKSYTPAEKDEFMACVRQPENDALLRELLRKASQAGLPVYKQREEKADAIFGAITGRDQWQEAATAETAAPARVRMYGATRLLRYAAVAVIALAAGLGFYYFSGPAAKPAVAVQAPAPAIPAKAAKTEEHRYIVLPDGSKVLLNSGSQLDYPAAFSGRRREVYLRGQAWFDIKQDTRKPFIVHTGKVKTVVLGTAFDIKAFPGQASVVVTVARGKVRVENEHKTLGILVHNEQLTVKDKEETSTRQLVKTEEAISWKAVDVLFDDTPLGEAVAELEKRFSIGITLEKAELAYCRVTASFLHHETAEEIIRVLCRINHMQYRSAGDNNNHLVLSGEGCR